MSRAANFFLPAQPAHLESDYRRASLRRRSRSEGRLAEGASILAVGFRCASALQRRTSPAGDGAAGKVGFKGALHKTAAFMEAHPFGTVPAAFSPDGKVGIFESNSIMRAVARLGESKFPLYGRGPYEAARVDSFLDASLVFARDAQLYLLSLMNGTVSSGDSFEGARRVCGICRRNQPGLSRPAASIWWAITSRLRTSVSPPS